MHDNFLCPHGEIGRHTILRGWRSFRAWEFESPCGHKGSRNVAFFYMMIDVLFEDQYILAVNKTAGLMVEPDRNGHPNLLHEVKKYLKQAHQSFNTIYAQHLHRLDRPVSGIVLFAKQKEVLRPLSEQFAQRLVKKKYIAITTQRPILLEGELRNWLRKEKKKAMLFNQPQDYAEEVWLEYSVSPVIDIFLWDITLHTGKFHQIRAQLSAAGCPIIGDELYGSSVPYLQNTIGLHAAQLEFIHPIGHHQVKLQCAPPWYDGTNIRWK